MTSSDWWTSFSNLDTRLFRRRICFTKFSICGRVLRAGGPADLDAVEVLDRVFLDGELEIVPGLDLHWRACILFGATFLTGGGVCDLVGAATGCNL